MKKQLELQCPKCGTRIKIAVNADADMQKLNLTCPVCKVKSPLLNYRNMESTPPTPPPVENIAGGAFRFNNPPAMGGASTCYENYPSSPANSAQSSDSTVFDTIHKIGGIKLPNGIFYPLNAGRNVIGRMAPSSSATTQIDMGPYKKRMGREHLCIQVDGDQFNGYRYSASLVRDRCNYTAIKGKEIKFGDVVSLSSGDIISLPDIDVVFVIPE